MNIDFELQIDGEYVDPDSNNVYFDDPLQVYGIRRTDTNATVVNRLTSMTRISTGVYRYVLAEPSPNLQYEYYLNFEIDGAPQLQHKFAGTGGGPGSEFPDPDVVGRYASRNGMNMRFGVDNVNKWADVSSSGEVAQTYAIQSAITQADDFIDGALKGGLIKTIPFTAPVPSMITNIANNLAAAYLYEAKGVKDYDEAGNVQHRLQYQKRWAMEQLDRIRRGILTLGVTTYNTIPLIIE